MIDNNRFEEVRFTAFFVFLVLFCFQIIAVSQTNESNNAQDEVVRIDTSLVKVPITVLDRDGRYVTNLNREDFQIYEDGIEQKIELFESVEQQVTVILLLDISGSMFADLEELTKAASTFLGQMRSDDQIMVAAFNDFVEVLFGFKSVKDVKNKKLRFKLDGRPPITMVYDAVEYGLKKMKKVRGRKAIILFSDGVGSGYNASAKSNLQDAEESEALIYTIWFDTTPKTRVKHESETGFRKRLENAKFGGKYMQNLAQISGGRNYQIEKIVELEETFQGIVDELKQQYNLGYYPKTEGKKGERRQIKVKVNQPNLAVRARSSYVIEKMK